MVIGFQALAEKYNIKLAQPLKIKSIVGTSRHSKELNHLVENYYPVNYRPEDSFAGHFEFGLKYEAIHLEFFARLFLVIGAEPIEQWCLNSPYGQYARRTGFFYEWILQKKLNVSDIDNGAYCDAISKKDYLVSSKPEKVKRWRINNNLPGNVNFCPLLRRTASLEKAIEFSFSESLEELSQQFGLDVLLRSASWLTFKESKASFLIEQEAQETNKVQRFAHVIAKECGKIEQPLSDKSLQALQASILGKNALSLGIRKSPVFVGQASFYENIVHYIAPHFSQVTSLLDGLKVFEKRTQGAEPIIRAAMLAFAFVYIHPMRDGNGRLHRFLINDLLIRDGAIPTNIILPISATITSSIHFRVGYDKALEAFSKSFMQRYAEDYHFGEIKTYEDGARSNFEFNEYQDAIWAWRYPDLTEQTQYLAEVIAHTVQVEMMQEAIILARFQKAQEALKNIIEMSDFDASRIIRSLKENEWHISNKLKTEYPLLEEQPLSQQVIAAVKDSFD